jgi:CDGSH-type Zn-finger protein
VYQKGTSFSGLKEPVALCRCGESKKKPFCDGSHAHADWDPSETASRRPLLDDSEQIDGETLVLTDNESYCAYARFCDAYGRVWNLVENARTEEERELVNREAAHCPGGRLITWDKKTGKPFEPELKPAIGLIEDPILKISGPIWVKGGIRVESADGSSYEIRNRVALCRCGQSSNKPFCDGTHASMKFHDGLALPPEGETW